MKNHSPKEQKESKSGHRTPETKPATVPADTFKKQNNSPPQMGKSELTAMNLPERKSNGRDADSLLTPSHMVDTNIE